MNKTMEKIFEKLLSVLIIVQIILQNVISDPSTLVVFQKGQNVVFHCASYIPFQKCTFRFDSLWIKEHAKIVRIFKDVRSRVTEFLKGQNFFFDTNFVGLPN